LVGAIIWLVIFVGVTIGLTFIPGPFPWWTIGLVFVIIAAIECRAYRGIALLPLDLGWGVSGKPSHPTRLAAPESCVRWMLGSGSRELLAAGHQLGLVILV
jgi:hypothetical protein